MLGREKVRSSGEALSLFLEKLPRKLPKEKVMPIADALGLICSRDVIAPDDLPSFARSTVDGYGVRAKDTFGASEAMPAYLQLGREIFMGEEAGFVLPEGVAGKIPTGGMLPPGADAVVMFEHVQAGDNGVIEVLKPVAPGENVIQAGEDVRAGATVVRRGQKIRPQDIGACSGIGVTGIAVYDKPVVAVISTGDEIVRAEERPVKGQVRDVNSYLIAGMVSESGGMPLRKGIFRDDYEAIRMVVLESVEHADLVAVSGGTSVGTKDMIARIINDVGNPGVIFHGVSLKPGKPMIGGIMHGIPIFGLPGHPAAVSICFEIFIRPVIEMLSGLEQKSIYGLRGVVKARLSRNLASAPGREEHVRVMIEERDDGFWAVPVLGKSGLITTLVKADGTIAIPLHRNGLEKGETVHVKLF